MQVMYNTLSKAARCVSPNNRFITNTAPHSGVHMKLVFGSQHVSLRDAFIECEKIVGDILLTFKKTFGIILLTFWERPTLNDSKFISLTENHEHWTYLFAMCSSLRQKKKKLGRNQYLFLRCSSER